MARKTKLKQKQKQKQKQTQEVRQKVVVNIGDVRKRRASAPRRKTAQAAPSSVSQPLKPVSQPQYIAPPQQPQPPAQAQQPQAQAQRQLPQSAVFQGQGAYVVPPVNPLALQAVPSGRESVSAPPSRPVSAPPSRPISAPPSVPSTPLPPDYASEMGVILPNDLGRMIRGDVEGMIAKGLNPFTGLPLGEGGAEKLEMPFKPLTLSFPQREQEEEPVQEPVQEEEPVESPLSLSRPPQEEPEELVEESPRSVFDPFRTQGPFTFGLSRPPQEEEEATNRIDREVSAVSFDGRKDRYVDAPLYTYDQLIGFLETASPSQKKTIRSRIEQGRYRK